MKKEENKKEQNSLAEDIANNKYSLLVYNKINELVDNLPANAVERAKKEDTRKGYDTTGYQYQFLINCINEVVAPCGWNYKYKIIKEVEGKFGNGKPYYDITVELDFTILDTTKTCVGGHRSEMYADALKGAITNSLKKTLGFFGIGKKAYEGTIDEDYRPIPVVNNSNNNNFIDIAKIQTEISNINNLNRLVEYFKLNSNKGKAVMELIIKRKKELIEKEKLQKEENKKENLTEKMNKWKEKKEDN